MKLLRMCKFKALQHHLALDSAVYINKIYYLVRNLIKLTSQSCKQKLCIKLLHLIKSLSKKETLKSLHTDAHCHIIVSFDEKYMCFIIWPKALFSVLRLPNTPPLSHNANCKLQSCSQIIAGDITKPVSTISWVDPVCFISQFSPWLALSVCSLDLFTLDF